MKKVVVHINNGTIGGPGGIVNNVYDALENLGYENYIVVPRGETKRNIKIIGKIDFYFSRILSKIFEKLAKKLDNDAFYPEIFCSNKTKRINKKIRKNIDIVILYWHKNYIDYKTIRDLKKTNDCKIFIYPMDEYILTGGCHYPEICKKYISGCGNCPGIFGGFFKKDFTYFYLKNMISILEEVEAVILCGNKTLLNLLDNNKLLKDIDKKLLITYLNYKYQEQIENIKEVREYFNLKIENKVIFFGATSLKNQRKGFKYLVESLKYISKKLPSEKKKKITFFIAGSGDIEEIYDLGFEISKIGYLSRKELIQAYKVSDLFVSSSIKDGGPMMVLESVMSGTPVICFEKVGCGEEFVWNDYTGYCAKFKDAIDMGEKILKYLNLSLEKTNAMKINCKKIGKELLSEETFIENIKNIFGD